MWNFENKIIPEICLVGIYVEATDNFRMKSFLQICQVTN